MELKGTYKLSYTLNKELKDLILLIELRQAEGINIKNRNVWEGVATLDGQSYTKEDLTHCVNARLAAERIGKQMKLKLKEDAQKAGHSFRIKKEEIK
jgi:hypothetical protein